MAVGTDSRASNPDLDLFMELKTIARHHPSVSPSKILEMGTIVGATCLGWDRHFGSLMPGKSAQMNIVSSSGIGSSGIQSLFDDDAICNPLKYDL
jgi:imidazolonepropionase-like amidohydrolase